MKENDISTQTNDNNNEDDYQGTLESLAYLEEEKAQRLVDFLEYSGIKDAQAVEDETNGTYEVQVPSKEFEQAENLYRVFSENELETDDAEPEDDILSSAGTLYTDSSEKYKDYFSSAITFFVCGIAGLVILLLNDFGVLHILSISGASFYLVNIVLGGLFVAFMIIGISSLKSSKKIKDQAEKESKAYQKVTDWLSDHVTEDEIESSYEHTIPEEMKYFNRSEYIKNQIKEEFSDIDEETCERITDKYIEDLFSDKSEK